MDDDLVVLPPFGLEIALAGFWLPEPHADE